MICSLLLICRTIHNILNILVLRNLKGGDFIYIYRLIYGSLDACLDHRVSMARTLNAIPELGPIDLYVNNVPFLINLDYMGLSSYRPALTSIDNVRYYPSGNKDNILLELKNYALHGGQIMTFALVDFSKGMEVLAIIDDINERVMPDETKVRIYNLDASDLTFALDNTSRGLEPGVGTEYFEINPGKYRLEVKTTNQKSMTIDLNPGRIYTIYIVGSINAKSPNYATHNIPQVILATDGNTVFSKC
jgi:Domain of unknown function (DUF4397)